MPPLLSVWGLGVVVGAGVSPWLSAGVAPLLTGLVGLVFLGWWRPGALVLRCGALACGLILGLLGHAVLPDPPTVDVPQRVTGEVVHRVGNTVDVDADVGRLRIRLRGKGPRVGRMMSAWVRPEPLRAVLPGAVPRHWGASLGKRTPVVAERWLPLGPEGGDRARLLRFARHAGLLLALSGGGTDDVPPDVLALMTRTGTRHLLAVSGLHLGIVAVGCLLVSRIFARPLAFLPSFWPARLAPAALTLGVCILFSAHVGWPTSTRRALLMLCVAVVSSVLGRRFCPTSALGAVGGLLVLSQPELVSDVGFRLSFGSVWGILVFGRWVLRWVPPDVPAGLRWVAGSVAASVGASCGTLADAALTFQMVSPVAPLANVIAGPLLAVFALPAVLLTQIVSGPLGLYAVAFADVSASLAIWILRWVDHDAWEIAVGWCGALVLACLPILRGRLGVTLWVLLVVLGLRRMPASSLEVTFLNVGQGDAALLRFPDGRVWLIDGGPPGSGLVRWLRRLGVARIDGVVLSHPHMDHMGGLLPVLERLDVGTVWVPRRPRRGERAFIDFWRLAHAQAERLEVPADDPPLAEWLHAPPEWTPPPKSATNDAGLVLTVRYGEHSFLFSGDIERAREAEIFERIGAVTVAKVAHHGSRFSSSPVWVAAADAEWSVVSAGRQNRYGHPHVEALSQWKGSRMARTDRDGSIRFVSDGQALTVSHSQDWTGWRPLLRAPWLPLSGHQR